MHLFFEITRKHTLRVILLVSSLFSQVLHAEEPNVLPLCYLHQFTVQNFPWPMGDCLNFEEVFKNYQYVEAKWDAKAKRLTVTHFEKGERKKTESYIYSVEKKVLLPVP